MSPAQAAADFRDYLALNAEGVRHDTRTKAYVASGAFEPVFGLPDASLALHAMWADGDPLLAELAPLERPVDAKMAARMRRAARDRQRVRVRYQSFTKPRPSWRWIAPARLVSDGQRWRESLVLSGFGMERLCSSPHSRYWRGRGGQRDSCGSGLDRNSRAGAGACRISVTGTKDGRRTRVRDVQRAVEDDCPSCSEDLCVAALGIGSTR